MISFSTETIDHKPKELLCEKVKIFNGGLAALDSLDSFINSLIDSFKKIELIFQVGLVGFVCKDIITAS